MAQAISAGGRAEVGKVDREDVRIQGQGDATSKEPMPEPDVLGSHSSFVPCKLCDLKLVI